MFSRSSRFALVGFASTLVLALTAGCESGDDANTTDPFIAALPTPDLITFDMPGRSVDDPNAGAQAGALDFSDAALVGDPSQLEGASFAVELLVRKLFRDVISDFGRAAKKAPRIKTDTRRVWFFESAGGQAQDLIVVERTPTGDFRVSIWLREIRDGAPKTWRFFAAAIVTPSGDKPNNARGTLWVDLEADRVVRTRGAILMTWTRTSSARDTEMTLFGASPDDGSQDPVNRAIRAHLERPGGYLAFDAGLVDIDQDPAQPQKESVRVYTRWNAFGHLRGDFTATGPDVTAADFRALVGSECWTAADRVVLFERRAGIPTASDQPKPLFANGDPATCPFGSEQPPILPAIGAPPGAPVPPPETDPDLNWDP